MLFCIREKINGISRLLVPDNLLHYLWLTTFSRHKAGRKFQPALFSGSCMVWYIVQIDWYRGPNLPRETRLPLLLLLFFRFELAADFHLLNPVVPHLLNFEQKSIRFQFRLFPFFWNPSE